MVNNRIKNGALRLASFIASVFLAAVVLSGCTGNTDGDSGASTGGGEFVDSDSATGSISLDVLDDQLQVSETSGFRVTAVNSSGQPAADIRITCDTEQGLALLEPTTTFELTDSGGQMSGRIGCAAQGSFQIGCRLATGANKRKFVTVFCSGPVPAGFTGFGDDAAGGGLGGGVDSGDGGVGGDDNSNLRITSIDFLDNGDTAEGASGTNSVDVIQGTCGTSNEPFFDTYIRIKVQNDTNRNVRCTSYTYSIPNGTGASTATLTSDRITFISDAIPASGGTGTIAALFLDVVDSGGGRKTFSGSSTVIADDFGFRNVSVRVSCTNDVGDTITLTGSSAASFDNFNSCSS